MVAQSGDKLLQDDGISAIKEYLIPLADIITPNLPEAEMMLDRKIESTLQMGQAAQDLVRLGCRSVLIKGGHLKEERSTDSLYIEDEKRLVEFHSEQIETTNNHGTGCTLSSAIAAQLAHGHDIQTAVANAKNYITAAIKAGADYELGKGHGPVHHFFSYWS
jgi:hydroxymethylpyrimidine/phosphomethylpyrimidine kinase